MARGMSYPSPGRPAAVAGQARGSFRRRPASAWPGIQVSHARVTRPPTRAYAPAHAPAHARRCVRARAHTPARTRAGAHAPARARARACRRSLARPTARWRKTMGFSMENPSCMRSAKPGRLLFFADEDVAHLCHGVSKRGVPRMPLETFSPESFHNQYSAEVLETGRPSCGWAKSR